MRNIEKDSVCKTYKLVDHSAYSHDLFSSFPMYVAALKRPCLKTFLNCPMLLYCTVSNLDTVWYSGIIGQWIEMDK